MYTYTHTHIILHSPPSLPLYPVYKKLQQLKDDISHQSKKNFQLEKELRYLDSKIALLIGHKISIEVH